MFKRLLIFRPSVSELGIFLFLALLGILVTLDLFIHTGRPITYDGPTHLTTIAQFGLGLKEMQLPVSWSDSFATFGLPIPMLAQQVTSYLGGIFYLISNDVIFSYNLVVLTAVIASAYLTYRCFKELVKPEAAFAGSILLMFAPYRLANIYIRGALPELFAGVWIPLMLWGVIKFIRDSEKSGLAFIWLGTLGLILTHPMMLLPAGLLVGPLAIFYLWQTKKELAQKVILMLVTGSLAVVSSAYYLLPLVMEIKYFYYGQVTSHYNDNHFLTWKNYLLPSWPYFTADAIGPRPQFLILGSLELAVLVASVVALVFLALTKRRSARWSLLALTWLIGVSVIGLTLAISRPLYLNLSLFSNMQHPWRFLTVLVFIPPLLLALLSDWLPRKLLPFVILLLMLFTITNRFPQLYGKNYTELPSTAYEATRDNLHGTYLNTIWSAEISDYPPKTEQLSLISGQAVVSNLEVRNAYRSFNVEAATEARFVDYTFYFPGWKVLVDGQPTTIEFQDTNYRGLITFVVPAGAHRVEAYFGDTKIRLLGKSLSVFALILSGLFFWLTQKFIKATYAKDHRVD